MPEPCEVQVGSEIFAAVHDRLVDQYGMPQRSTPRPVLDDLIGTILSQNTTGTNSRRAYETLRTRFPTWQDVLDHDVTEISDAIRVAGLANIRAARIQGVLQQVWAEHGKFDLEHLRDWPPAEVQRYLTSFKGVGVKTASCVQLFALQRPDFTVDTHVHRIVRLLGWVPEAYSRDETYTCLNPAIDDDLKFSLHVNLLRHGKQVCKARAPQCGACTLQSLCDHAQSLDYLVPNVDRSLPTPRETRS